MPWLQQVVPDDAVEALVAQALALVDGAPGPLPDFGVHPGAVFGEDGELVGAGLEVQGDGSLEAGGTGKNSCRLSASRFSTRGNTAGSMSTRAKVFLPRPGPTWKTWRSIFCATRFRWRR